jgi:hypothetical protein
MSRYFEKITIDELRSKIEPLLNQIVNRHGWRSMTPQIEKDLKVKFDCENVETSGWKDEQKKVLDYQTLPNGLTFFGLCCGGDWEMPVVWIIYWDGKKLRAYVPTKGNPWNHTTHQAFGNDSDADLKDAKKQWPDYFAGFPLGDEEFDVEDCPDHVNYVEILKDIENRILPRK